MEGQGRSTEKVTFTQRPEGENRTNLAEILGERNYRRRNIKDKGSEVRESLALRRRIKNDNVAAMSLERKKEIRDGDREGAEFRSSKALKTTVRTFSLKLSEIGCDPTPYYVWRYILIICCFPHTL